MYFRKKTACAVLSAMFLFGMPYISFAQEADETTSAEESTDALPF